MNKKAVIFMILGVVVLLGLVAGILYVSGVLPTQSSVGSTTIWTVEYGRLSCEEDSQQTVIEKYADQGYTFECGDDYLVDSCKVVFECSEDTSWLKPSCSSWYVLNGNKIEYTLSRGGQDTINLEPGDEITFKDYSLGYNEDYVTINYEFNIYRLYTYESGGKFLSSSSDCCLANQNELQRNQFEAGDWDCLSTSGTDSWRNYFLDWTLISGAKVYKYEGEEVICRSNALYELEEIDLADGTTRLVQGDKIENVECCPHQDDNCDSDTFEFIQEEEERECEYDYQCANSGNPYSLSGTTYKIEECIDYECVETTKTAECTTDTMCRNLYGDNYACDLSSDNFGNCILIGQIEQEYCGNSVCDNGETYETCPSDCSEGGGEEQLTCNWYQTYVKKTRCGLLCRIGLRDETVIEKCAVSTWVYTVSLGFLLTILIVVLVLIKRRR